MGIPPSIRQKWRIDCWCWEICTEEKRKSKQRQSESRSIKSQKQGSNYRKIKIEPSAKRWSDCFLLECLAPSPSVLLFRPQEGHGVGIEGAEANGGVQAKVGLIGAHVRLVCDLDFFQVICDTAKVDFFRTSFFWPRLQIQYSKFSAKLYWL